MLAKPLVISSVLFGSRNASLRASRDSASRSEPFAAAGLHLVLKHGLLAVHRLSVFPYDRLRNVFVQTTFDVCSKKLSISLRECMIVAFARARNAGSAGEAVAGAAEAAGGVIGRFVLCTEQRRAGQNRCQQRQQCQQGFTGMVPRLIYAALRSDTRKSWTTGVIQSRTLIAAHRPWMKYRRPMVQSIVAFTNFALVLLDIGELNA